MKGIILAGGRGTRLFPLTRGVSKQLLPIYNKPLIYYPLTTLMMAGIREILIITTPEDSSQFQRALEDGRQWGIKLQYGVQDAPRGLADAFIVGREFCAGENTALVLGDNIIYGNGLAEILAQAAKQDQGATIFGYPVRDPERYGVIELNLQNQAVNIEEKPAHPHSNLAIPGIYFYDATVVEKARSLKPSDRNELEITDLNCLYLREGKLHVSILGRGIAWLDAGTFESLIQASNYVQTIEERQGLVIASPEEVAFSQGFINKEEFQALIERLPENGYKASLTQLLRENNR